MIAKKSQVECPAGSHPGQFQNHHPKGQSMGSKQPETNILVFPLFHLVTTACSTSVRLHYNWSERVCACMLEGPSLSYVFQVFKMGKKAHVIRLAMPSFSALISAGSESLSRQRRPKPKELSTYHIQTQKGCLAF